MPQQRIGQCHLCGIEKELTLEHIPPQKAFNDSRVLMYQIATAASDSKAQYVPVHPVMQGGLCAYTLCASCNNNTGSWYGRAYVDFVKACAQHAEESNVNRIVSIATKIYPLKVMKQALVILCSCCGSKFTDKQQGIRKLLLDKMREDCHVLYDCLRTLNATTVDVHQGLVVL